MARRLAYVPLYRTPWPWTDTLPARLTRIGGTEMRAKLEARFINSTPCDKHRLWFSGWPLATTGSEPRTAAVVAWTFFDLLKRP